MPPSSKKSAHSRLSAQVRWQHPDLSQGGIDQTQIAIADAPSEGVPFSFMVIGDTDAGISTQLDLITFSEMFSDQLMQQLGNSRFLLHTGDVTYPVGSYQNYWQGFLRPYQRLLSKSPSGAGYCSESVVFNRPLLPVPGNHDYAKSEAWLWDGLLRVLCDRLRPLATSLGVALGHYGGQGGEAYGQTFLDDLRKLSSEQLTAHLLANYSAALPNRAAFNKTVDTLQYCLNYRPGQFTRLPNRYYRFRYGGVDFFALDSNTWNTAPEADGFDQQQLDWLEQVLIESWQMPNTIARIIYLHHSPYTTEATRWQQSETLWVRRHLRAVLSRVAATAPATHSVARSRSTPVVDLVISGHAHCFEHIKTRDTSHADAYMDWVVCGGSGTGLRRQREAGVDILEQISSQGKSYTRVVAQSQMYAGVHGSGPNKQQFHSFLRVEVQPHQRQKLLVRPFVVSQGIEGWQTEGLMPIKIGELQMGLNRVQV